MATSLPKRSADSVRGIAFAGVIYAHQPHVTLGQCIADLELIARVGEQADLANRVYYLALADPNRREGRRSASTFASRTPVGWSCCVLRSPSVCTAKPSASTAATAPTCTTESGPDLRLETAGEYWERPSSDRARRRIATGLAIVRPGREGNLAIGA